MVSMYCLPLMESLFQLPTVALQCIVRKLLSSLLEVNQCCCMYTIVAIWSHLL